MDKNVFISKHPLVLDKISKLRDKNTSTADFRRGMCEISMLLAHDVLSNARVKASRVNTPLGSCKAMRLSHDIIFVAILRAGLGMLEGLIKVHPEARLAHIGIYRDESTLKPVKYYVRLPDKINKSLVVLVDPMLATGGSAAEAVEILKARGAKKIIFMGLIGAREGVKRLAAAHPDVPIYIGTVDDRLNNDGYIVPGLGDAGDRMFGTN
ncbi:MAG: uracil phosphoribosyltransferase [Elusimicrobia bacterium RIFOXYA12_FULL_51_18]|nr:MAG: uracil phosphoribosyltransferase [Elusimicrobia bacterium RIFOXYA12_FULL_51_18]